MCGMQALTAVFTGAALGAAGTYQMYHAVWKSRDKVAEQSSLYVQQHDPTGRQVRDGAPSLTRRASSSDARCRANPAPPLRLPRLQLPPKRLHEEVSRNFTDRWNKGVLGLHSMLVDMLSSAQQR